MRVRKGSHENASNVREALLCRQCSYTTRQIRSNDKQRSISGGNPYVKYTSRAGPA